MIESGQQSGRAFPAAQASTLSPPPLLPHCPCEPFPALLTPCHFFPSQDSAENDYVFILAIYIISKYSTFKYRPHSNNFCSLIFLPLHVTPSIFLANYLCALLSCLCIIFFKNLMLGLAGRKYCLHTFLFREWMDAIYHIKMLT